MSSRAEGRPGSARQVINNHQPEPLLRFEFDRGSNYEEDTRVTTVLGAVVTDDDIHHDDHRFFQINHLQTELAWAQMHDGMTHAVVALDAQDAARALHSLERAITAASVPLHCCRALQDSLPQVSLLAMRALFPPNTTGLDSPGMRNLRRAARALWPALVRAAEASESTIEELVRLRGSTANNNPGLLLLGDVARAAHRLDNRVLEWKRAHIQLVWMTVGGNTLSDSSSADITATSLRGNHITDLERMAVRPLLPQLWDLTTQTFSQLTTPDGPYARTDDPRENQ